MTDAADDVELRLAAAGDRGFLEQMLQEAAGWDPQRPRLTPAQVLADPQLAHYVQGWGGPEDLGVIAEIGGRPVGAAWIRRFPADDPGYGFVAEDVPELSIAVVAGWRGRGIGSALLEVMAEAASSRGVGAICLSVETANPARVLYTSHGFREVSSAQGSVTMLRDL
ncbi:MAG: GNAT family N-acetyltransferase [Actinomycetota bacterium]|jgi:GNAT superfamily N-acetyltransferase|nr:GNAT family N-acetyltransferase [Euzebyales bacterium]MDQ3342399.1 GNAT family N-acetyltransferase [Actinomycetota bacterium]MDQ3528585.1 GNAT family N-acetyltransferase [Actinomycetota bacterium]